MEEINLTKVTHTENPNRNSLSNGDDNTHYNNSDVPDVKIKDGKEKKEKMQTVSMLQLFRFADKWDVIMMVFGLICACGHGSALPVMIIVFGDMTTSFTNSSYINNLVIPSSTRPSLITTEMVSNFATNAGLTTLLSNSSITAQNLQITSLPNLMVNNPISTFNKSDKDIYDIAMDMFMDQIRQSSIYYAIIGCVVLVVGYVQVTCWLIVSYRQTFKLRRLLFTSVLHQEIGWFDTNDAGELSTRLSDDVNKIQEGLGDKISNFFQWMATFVSGIIIGLVFGWKLALVVLAVSPLLIISGGIMTYMITNATNKELTAYAKAGAVAEEVITAIRTVVAFSGQEKECQRYTSNLKEAKQFGIRKGMFNGGGMGMVFFIMFSSYGLAFWYGGQLITKQEMEIGDMLIVFFCVVIGAFALGNAGPNLQSVGTARGAAYNLWSLVDRRSKIDSSDPSGKKLESLIGNIEFKDIHFHFPSRPEVKILKGLNMKIRQGQTVAVVGASGCGKSTVIQLLQRFYDPIEGHVTIDGVDIKDMNIKWLRQQIGIVSQEPVLFAKTIAENIAYGCEGATQEQIEEAAKEANAHGFISKLPKQYETLVGERGAQLSGGQKQRIAIARALIKNPKIVLLDEATSALDTESEATVQAALDKVQSGRTTIVVAHRLSTIKNADLIYGIQDGVVHEAGTHDELMELGGIYYQLVTNQKMNGNEDDENTYDEIVENGKQNGYQRMNSIKDVVEDVVHDRANEKEAHKPKEVSMIRVFKYNLPEWYIIIIGCIAATIQGAIQPSFAIIFAKFLGIFGSAVAEEDRNRQIIIYSCLFVVLGVIAAVSMFLQATMFAISGERLTQRMRELIFKHLLRQNISFFDDHNNGVGALTTRLATDASAVQGATGVRFGMAFQSLASVGAGIIIGFIYSWKLTLLIIAWCPFIVAAGMLQMRLAKGFSGKNSSALEASGKIATEAISNVRTVASLTLEDKMVNDYLDQLSGPHKQNLRKSHIYGIAFSFSQSLIFFAYAAIFMFGAYLIKIGDLYYEDMFTVFGAIIFGAMSLGQASQFAPDYAKAKASVNRIFDLLDSNPSIDISSPDGLKPGMCKGSIDFKSVTFAYPTRETVKVLKKLDMNVEPGTTVALVGSSGCGKSTTVQLLERFYDVLEGSITLDGNDLRTLNVAWLRAQLGIVSQEPILFDCSIKENIAYGDNSREVEENEIIQAARMANIHGFIESLPQGYETGVGDKGTQLSGGQKQRIAIARALVRNPKILLLDEATSALDTESEKVVQEALDRAQEGRTSLVIAHRLSTIQNANCIFVFQNGVIAEFGTHSELMSLKGIYYRLNRAQGHKS